MRLLTATREAQGELPGDFCFTVEGELVLPNDLVCARDRGNPHGGCGCGRAFVGLGSRRATTTALVRDLDIAPSELRTAVEDFQETRGLGRDVIGAAEFDEVVETELALLERISCAVPVDAVVGLRLERLVWRRYPAVTGAG